MPRSNGEGVTALHAHFNELNPKTVVDVGPGVGTYAQAYRSSMEQHWTAIEIWRPYVDVYGLNEIYDEVIVGDVRDVELPKADLYIAGDVLEHMSRVEALLVIDRIKRSAEHLMVSVPIVHYEQGALEGNPFETHHYHWSADEMSAVLGAAPVVSPTWQCGSWCVPTASIPPISRSELLHAVAEAGRRGVAGLEVLKRAAEKAKNE